MVRYPEILLQLLLGYVPRTETSMSYSQDPITLLYTPRIRTKTRYSKHHPKHEPGARIPDEPAGQRHAVGTCSVLQTDWVRGWVYL